MGFILRKIRRSKWYKNPNVPWLSEGELQADAIHDLKTDNNTLSIYRIEDRSEFNRLVAAMMANKDSLANFDYALMPETVLEALEISKRATPGNTPDRVVNDWHFDMVQLTAQKLMNLASTIHTQGEIKRIPWKEIGDWIRDAIINQHCDRDKVNDNILKKLDL